MSFKAVFVQLVSLKINFAINLKNINYAKLILPIENLMENR